MLGAVFERFVEKSPISVMVRASLERVLGADRLDLWYERTAQKHLFHMIDTPIFQLRIEVLMRNLKKVSQLFRIVEAKQVCH
ncbi:MAG TPA: hypothetical protein VFC02_06415, partial [Anaerolineales bacterium]|nr:hypothetical protein [Anaerolineales bacterium]